MIRTNKLVLQLCNLLLDERHRVFIGHRRFDNYEEADPIPYPPDPAILPDGLFGIFS